MAHVLHQHLRQKSALRWLPASAAPLWLCSVLGVCLRDLGVGFSDLYPSVQLTMLMHTILG